MMSVAVDRCPHEVHTLFEPTRLVEVEMKKSSTRKQDDYDLREDYDLLKMTVLPKGRFDPKRRVGNNVIVLDADVAEAFHGDNAVNEALRQFLKAGKITHGTAK